MSRNPQLSQVLNDPEMMRRSMEMMRNPEAMRQAMRSQELGEGEGWMERDEAGDSKSGVRDIHIANISPLVNSLLSPPIAAMSQIENMPGGMDHLRRMYEEVQAPMEEAMAPNTSNPLPSNTNDSTAGVQGTPMPNPWGSNSAASNQAASTTTVPQGAPGGNPAANPFAFPGMGGMGGQMPDMNALSSMLDNPMMQQAMQQMASNPEMLQTMVNSNPMLRQMMDSNPMLRDMMSNPAVMQQMMNPQSMRTMMNMQQAMGGAGGSGGGGAGNPFAGFPTPPPAPAATPETATINGLDFSSLINNMNPGGGIPTPQPAAPQQQPRDRFARQLTSLHDMGFTDEEANLTALQATNGNVNRAVERLLSS